MPLSAERGPACREGSAGIQPICCSSVSPSFPFPRQQGEEAAWSARPPRFLHRWKNKERLAGSQVAPGGPVLPPASPPGSQPSGCLRRLSPPVALLELGCSPQLRPPPRQSCLGVTSILSPRHGASGKVLRGDLLTTDPPQQQQSAAPGSGSLISFILFFFCYYCLHLSFIPTPVPSAGSSCPPASAGSRNQTPPGPDAISLRRQHSSCSQPCQRQERGLAHGKPYKLLIPGLVVVLADSRAASGMVAECSAGGAELQDSFQSPALAPSPAALCSSAGEIQPVVCRRQLSLLWVMDAQWFG